MPIIAGSLFMIGINCFCNDSNMEAGNFPMFMQIISRLFQSIQIMLINLKLDKLVKWKWKESFWAYWIFLSVMTGLSLSAFQMLFAKIISSICTVNYGLRRDLVSSSKTQYEKFKNIEK